MSGSSETILRLQRQMQLHVPRVRRYLNPIIRHGTPRKLANIFLAEAELRLGRSTLRAYPYYYLIDICNVCNLKCPLCPTGANAVKRTQGVMSFEEYRTILDKVRRHALVVSLYNHGEPFLNKAIFDIIDYTARSNIATNVSSNFNWPMPIDTKDIVRSGLEYITVSLDGVTQESYEKYRVDGNIDEVFDNMKSLLAARKELGSRTPLIEWQFIVFKHNEHEMDRARELAREWGVDLLRFVAPGIPPEMMDDPELREKWMPRDPLYAERNPEEAAERGYVYDRNCFYLYRSMAIYYGGGVTPCCFAHDRTQDFGNILDSSVDQIWNNHHYRSARMLFSGAANGEDRLEVVCDACPLFRQSHGGTCGRQQNLLVAGAGDSPPVGNGSSAAGASRTSPI